MIDDMAVIDVDVIPLICRMDVVDVGPQPRPIVVVDVVMRHLEPGAVKPFHPAGFPQDVDSGCAVVVYLIAGDYPIIGVTTKSELAIVLESVPHHLAAGRA